MAFLSPDVNHVTERSVSMPEVVVMDHDEDGDSRGNSLQINGNHHLFVQKDNERRTSTGALSLRNTSDQQHHLQLRDSGKLGGSVGRNVSGSMLKMPSVSQLLKITLGSKGTPSCTPTPRHRPLILLSAPPSPPDVECTLCLNLVPASQLFTIQQCGCAFCRQCLRQYLALNIKEGNIRLPCPNNNCLSEGSLEVQEIKEIVAPEVFKLYQRYKLNKEVRKDETRVWCPRNGCESICNVEPGKPVCCSKCETVFCPSCLRGWHNGGPCERSTSAENLIPSSGEDIKACPNCHVLIERNDGCAQMMCKYCEHIFCWHCLASLDEDVFLKHFDKGPCKNKLGHSKASLMWHRARVAAFMAGLGLLLLAVSPLLLLAAPCLLCRCKQIRGFLQEDSSAPTAPPPPPPHLL